MRTTLLLGAVVAAAVAMPAAAQEFDVYGDGEYLGKMYYEGDDEYGAIIAAEGDAARIYVDECWSCGEVLGTYNATMYDYEDGGCGGEVQDPYGNWSSLYGEGAFTVTGEGFIYEVFLCDGSIGAVIEGYVN